WLVARAKAYGLDGPLIVSVQARKINHQHISVGIVGRAICLDGDPVCQRISRAYAVKAQPAPSVAVAAAEGHDGGPGGVKRRVLEVEGVGAEVGHDGYRHSAGGAGQTAIAYQELEYALLNHGGLFETTEKRSARIGPCHLHRRP